MNITHIEGDTYKVIAPNGMTYIAVASNATGVTHVTVKGTPYNGWMRDTALEKKFNRGLFDQLWIGLQRQGFAK